MPDTERFVSTLSRREPGLQAGGQHSYGRWVIDLDRGWSTERLDLEPLAVAHAAELAPLLDDPFLHEFIGGAPLSAAALAARYTRLAAHRSPTGDPDVGQLAGTRARHRH